MPDDDLFRDDLFPQDESEFFDDLAGEEPFFPGDEEEFPFDMDEAHQESGGVSRVFKILGGVLLLAVIGIVVALGVLLLGRDQGPTDNESTSTAVIATNTAVQIAYQNTVTAQALMVQATENAVQTQIALATATENAFQTQQAIAATSAAQTATAGFIASQTAQAVASQTAVVAATQTEIARVQNTLRGQLIGPDGQVYGNVTLRLFFDDANDEFNPPIAAFLTPVPASQTGTSGSTAVPLPGAQGSTILVNVLAYGDTVQDVLEANTPDLWNFSGAAGDVLTIDAVADNNMQTDMFLDLKGPNGSSLKTDDDSGGDFNASIVAFELPTTGNYVIEVSSVSGPGGYTLSLALAGAASESETDEAPAPTEESGGVSYVPRAAGVDLGAVVLVAQGGSTPDPSATPQPVGGDSLIIELTTDENGQFDFGELAPGTYWLEIDYNTLSPELQALYSPDQPIFIRVIVPATGEPLIIDPANILPALAVTPTPQPPTATAEGPTATPGGLVTATPSPEINTTLVTVTPIEALPTTGFFGDIADSAGGLEGSNGLMILAIAAVGLVAVVFIARRLRMS